MIEPRIVRRYASALFGAASKTGVVDRVESDLGLVSYVFESSPRLAESVESPLVPSSRKRDILSDIFRDKVHEVTLSYLSLLVDKRREAAILQTEGEYIQLANAARGIVAVKVTSAVKLSEGEEASLTAKLAEMTGKTVYLEKLVDASLIGGVIVRIGDRVIDGSIKGQLAALRDKMLS
ncbi:MAG: F0F1 ATP synthase subunit delta [Armatimonadota bacterium]|nr:F0F1 ATP synthase subunit delta [bacterium]